MNATASFRNNAWNNLNWLLAGLALALAPPGRAATPPAAIPFSDIGARATAGYQGDASIITPTADGARLRCGFQKLEGHATTQGLWLESTAASGGRLRLVATVVGRDSSRARECTLTEPDVLALFAPTDVGGYTALATSGNVSVNDKLVRFTRPGLTEEYSVSVDGVRQDFIIESPPINPPLSTLNPQPSTLNHSAGDLRVELALSGARAEAAAGGARLRLDGSGRVLAYSRLRAEDAMGRELTAHLEVVSADRLAVSVADANASYPVRIDPTFSDADWVSLNPGLPGADGTVSAMAVDANGSVYVCGGFGVIGTVPANCIAKWDGSAWSALGSGVNNAFLSALAVSGTNLYAGGVFTTAGGVTAYNIAKWDGSAWSALGPGLWGGSGSCVYALLVSGSNLYAGGQFTTAGGVTVYNIAKWNGSAWSALGSGIVGYVNASADIYSSVFALAASGTYLYAGGYFTNAGGVPANCIAKWDGHAWSALGSGIGGGGYAVVEALVVRGTDLYAGGAFTTAGGVTANSIAKWNGTAWSALGSGMGMNGSVRALAVSGTNLYSGGQFSTAGGVPANNIAKWNGSAWSALGSGMNGGVFALAVSGTDLYAGGNFTTVGGVPANCIAKWDGHAWSALGSGIGGGGYAVVEALVVRGTDLYAGGEFTTAGGVTANYIAKWNGSAWSALGSGMNGGVFALAVSGTDLYAGGNFTTVGGVPANCIAKWDGHAWSALGSGIGGGGYAVVEALVVRGTDLYAGGEFTTAGGVTANNIAKWNGSAWSALGSGVSGYVNALAVSGTDLYAGGRFSTAGGVTEINVAKWNGSAWAALGSGMSQLVLALAVSGTDLYAGGCFYRADEVLVNFIAKWDGSAWLPLGSGMSGMNECVYALAADRAGHLFVGGDFSLAGTNVSPYIAQANLGSVPTILTAPPTQTAEAGATVDFAVDAAGGYLTYLLFLNGRNLLSCGSDNCLELTNVDSSQSGTYTVVVTNVFGAVTSAPVILNVIPAVERRPAAALQLMGETGSLLNVDYANALSATPNWLPLDTVAMESTPQYYFDLTTPLPPQRFYRAWQTGAPGVRPSLDLHMLPAITVTGGIGSSVRVDCINRLGPIDAWVTLDTVTLTNTSQLYFDITAPGQPERLYRLVPSP